jgi:hypothetical protein
MLYGSATLGILFSVALFILLPNLLTSGISQLSGLGREGAGRGTTVLLNLIEGLIGSACLSVTWHWPIG